MTKHWFREPERDPALAAALRRAETRGASPDAAAGVEEDALRARIVAAARPRLRALRALRGAGGEPPRPWWEWMAALSRAAIPVGLAASLAAAAVLVQDAASLETAAVAADSVASGQLLLGATGVEAEAVRTQFVDQLLAPVDGDWLLSEAMSR